MKSKARNRVKNPVHELQELSWRIQGLAHLLASAGDSGDERLQTSYWGLGSLLDQIAKRVMTISHSIEDDELKRIEAHSK